MDSPFRTRIGDIDRRGFALDAFLLAHAWGGTMQPNKSIKTFGLKTAEAQ
jgi:hypothetical protein